MKRAITIFLLFVGLALTAAGGWFLIKKKASSIPDQNIEKARKAISLAGKSRSNIYAAPHYHHALNAYDSAVLLWKEENSKFFLLRDYSRINSYAENAFLLANAASLEASVKSSSLNMTLKQSIHKLQTRINEYEHFHNLPLPADVRKTIAEADQVFGEAVKLHEQGQLLKSLAMLNAVSTKLQNTDEFIRTMFEEWFAMHKQWTSWTEEAVKTSKKENAAVIIIDKFSRQCNLYQSGSLSHTFTVELGKNWIGDKQYKGDKTTPEGKYTVVEKKKGRSTKYHKALLLNYPNEEDKIRFAEAVRKGHISEKKHIGNLIEIHGDGGRGFDWTDGCIALKNKDMDILFAHVEKGTQVIIVGSLKPLNDYQHLLK